MATKKENKFVKVGDPKKYTKLKKQLAALKESCSSVVQRAANNLPDPVKAAIKGTGDIEPLYEFIAQYRGHIPLAKLLDPKLQN